MKGGEIIPKLCIKTTVLCTLGRQPVCTPDTALTLLLPPPKVRLQPDHDEGGGRQVPEEGVEGVHQDDQCLMHLRASGKTLLSSLKTSCLFQANAALALEQGDLTTFTDLINTKDVESGSREARHWINSSTGEARGSLVEMAINRGRTDFLDVLLRAGARWGFSFVLTGNEGIPRLDMVGEMSGLAAGHLAVEKGSAMLTLLLSHRDSWDVNIRCPSNWRCFKDHT